jgi:hypothetical protein
MTKYDPGSGLPASCCDHFVRGLDHYRSAGMKYTVDFSGDDELNELNEGIRQITEENQQLSKRIKDLREKYSMNIPQGK